LAPWETRSGGAGGSDSEASPACDFGWERPERLKSSGQVYDDGENVSTRS